MTHSQVQVDLDALDALHRAATPGEWIAIGPFDADTGFGKWWDIWTDSGSVAHVAEDARPDEGVPRCKADVAAIVSLVNAYPALAHELRQLREVARAAVALRERSNRELLHWKNLVGHYADTDWRRDHARHEVTQICELQATYDAAIKAATGGKG